MPVTVLYPAYSPTPSWLMIHAELTLWVEWYHSSQPQESGCSILWVQDEARDLNSRLSTRLLAKVASIVL